MMPSRGTSDVIFEPFVQLPIYPRTDEDLLECPSPYHAEEFPISELKAIEITGVCELNEVIKRLANGNFDTRKAGELVKDRNEVEEDFAVVGSVDVEAVLGKCHCDQAGLRVHRVELYECVKVIDDAGGRSFLLRKVY